MANVDKPNGFKPVRSLTGGTIRTNEYPIASATAAGIYSGDTVELLATGYIDAATASSTTILGVFAGCKYTDSSGNVVYNKYWPAGTVTLGSGDATAIVYDDPATVFEAQHDGTGAFANNGALLDLTATTGSTSTGNSLQEIDSDASTIDAFRQIRLVPRTGNAWGTNARVEVVIHKHALAQAAGAAI